MFSQLLKCSLWLGVKVQLPTSQSQVINNETVHIFVVFMTPLETADLSATLPVNTCLSEDSLGCTSHGL